MKSRLFSLILGMYCPAILAQNVFDYSIFTVGQAPLNIPIEKQFVLQNFNACWNLKFTNTLPNSTPYVLTGKEVVKELTKEIPDMVFQISLDRKTITMTKPVDVPLGNVSFIPVRTASECESLNTKLLSRDLTVSVVMPAGAGVAKGVNESTDIPSERSPFYDAILLQKMLNKNENDKIVALLSLYGIDFANIDSFEPLKPHKPILFPASSSSTTTVIVTNNETELSTKTQGTGTSFVTTLTEALAQFIAKRVKEELTLAYLSRFRAYLEEKNNTIRIGVLLPESYKVMMEVEPYDYTTYWLAMQEGFQDDVAQFPENTMSFVRVHESKFNNKDAYAGTLTGLYVLKGAYRKYSAVAILDSLESLPEVSKFAADNVSASLRTLSLLSRNLHHLETQSDGSSVSKGWIRSNELVALSNAQTRDFFMGLLIAREKDLFNTIDFKVSSGIPITLRSILLKEYTEDGFNHKLGDLLAKLEALTNAEKVVGKESDKIEDEDNTKKKVRTTFERYETYARSLLSLVDYSGEWVSRMAVHNSAIIKAEPILKTVSVVTQATVDLTKHMSEKRYNLAFFDVVKLLKEVQGKHFVETIDAASAFSGQPDQQRLLRDNLSLLGIADADLSQLTPNQLVVAGENIKKVPKSDRQKVEKVLQTLDAYSKWDWEKFAKYGSFISNVAGADSAAQIVAALEAAALPAGSYRIKHEDRFTVSLNAYGGLNYSRETFKRIDVLTDNEKKDIKSTFALTPYAPVGLSFSWGLKKQWVESLTLFVPVIDVGAAFALRFKSDLKTLPDQLAWDNILAPGIHLVAGFRNSPITASLGAQYGAGLRKLEYDKDAKSIPFSAQSVWYGITLSVDVPIFTLHVGKGYTRK